MTVWTKTCFDTAFSQFLICISLLGPLPKDFTYRGSPSNPSSPASVKEPDSPDLTPPPSPAHTPEPLLQRTSNYPNNGTYSMLKKSKGMVQTLFGDSLLSYNSITFCPWQLIDLEVSNFEYLSQFRLKIKSMFLVATLFTCSSLLSNNLRTTPKDNNLMNA